MKGSIRKRSSGSWEVRVFAGVDPRTGKKRWVSRTAHGSLSDAEALAAELIVGVNQGTLATTGGTFGDLLEEWFALMSPDWSPSTTLNTRRFMDTILLPELGKLPLRRVRPSNLSALYAKLRKRMEATSVRRIHTVVRSALAYAVRAELLPSNPALNAELPKAGKVTVTVASVDEVNAVIKLAAAKEPELGLFLRLAAATGARRSELCALRWSDLAGELVKIDRAVVHGPSGLVEKEPKTTDSTRPVVIGAATVALLARHRMAMAERALRCGTGIAADAFVFSYEPDCAKPWRPEGVTHRFVRLRNQLGLKWRLHDLRHFTGTRLVDAGVPMPVVSARLGHSRTSTTSDFYAHAVDERDRLAAEVMERLLG